MYGNLVLAKADGSMRPICNVLACLSASLASVSAMSLKWLLLWPFTLCKVIEIFFPEMVVLIELSSE